MQGASMQTDQSYCFLYNWKVRNVLPFEVVQYELCVQT